MSKPVQHQRLPTQWPAREVLREKGQFWTPDWVADAMIRYVSANTDFVFDPATGRGAFLRALRRLDTPKIAFYGTDIDPTVLSDEVYNQADSTVELRDFIKNPPKRRFRAIVANPPYIRHHRLDEETKLLLKSISVQTMGFAIDEGAGYHIYFLIQALSTLESGGRLAFIMPADSCEGTFAPKLWQWIGEIFCLRGLATFEQAATPFPGVDTNAVLFFLEKSPPQPQVAWVRVSQPYTTELADFVHSDFTDASLSTLSVEHRQLKEALRTGLSRPQQGEEGHRYHLHDFATVMRGIATGANEFFFLTHRQAHALQIPTQYLKNAVGRTRDIPGDCFTNDHLTELDLAGRPTLLLSLTKADGLNPIIEQYLKQGEAGGLPDRSLIKQRRPWFKMEKRDVPPLLFAYLGRRITRFILNQAGMLPLTGFVCVYPVHREPEYVTHSWQALNHLDTQENLHLVGKSYGSGALKVEPRSLDKLPIPAHIGQQFELNQPYILTDGQLDLFREPQP